MANILLFSDLHIHPHKKSLERLEDCLKIIPWVFNVAKENNVKNILFGGDFFHDRHKIDIYTYHRAYDTLKNSIKDTDINIWFLLGNHDLWFYENTDISSVHPFSSIKGVKVISKPSRFEIDGLNWDFLPFTQNPVNSLKILNSLEGEKQCLIGHIALNQAKMHIGKYASDIVVEHEGDMVSVDTDLFMEYEQVFLGHFHSEQKVNAKVEYIGSPLQLSFGEAFEDKHLILLDSKTRKKKYINNDFSPKHFILTKEDIKKYDLNGNFVHLLVDDMSNVDIIKLKKDLLNENKIVDFKIKQNISKKNKPTDDIKDVVYDEKEMLNKYVAQSKVELDKELLVKIGKKICEYKAQES
jgi:DNA repair exonuclease SbcCD nuclease subunit